MSAIRMATAWTASVAIAVLAVGALPAVAIQGEPTPAPTLHAQRTASADRLVAAIRKVGIRFEPNIGQAPSRIKYLARAHGYMIGLTKQGLILKLEAPSAVRSHRIALVARRRTHDILAAPVLVSMRPLHANTDPSLAPQDRLASISNYFIGNNPKHWHIRVTNYAAVRYRDIYPGVDWIVYGNPNRLEYDLVVAPHADPRQIRFRIAGAERIFLDSQGSLVIKAGHHTLRALKPLIYQ
ncbi:MAG: hypothetical protein ACRETQ_10030, partial [Gammaproteobacteria bacterium]